MTFKGFIYKGEVEFAQWINQVPKVVFSTTREKVEWKGARLVHVDDNRDIANAVKLDNRGIYDVVYRRQT